MPSRTAVSLAALAAGAGLVAAAAACSQPAGGPPAAQPMVFGDWRADAPGVRHRITVADLPAPFVKVGAAPAKVVDAPPGALPKVPAGFVVTRFASGLQTPRAMRTAPNGDIFVAEQEAGRIRVLRAAPGAAEPSQKEIFIAGLDRPFGMAFYPLGPNPTWLYIAELNRVVRVPYANGALKAAGKPEVVIPKLAETTGGHWTRDLAFTPDGKRLLVSVGSSSNLAEGMPTKTPAEAAAWNASHGLGAAWDADVNRADVLAADPEGHGLHVYAAGIRNCSGLTVQPATGRPWCSVNERDMIGDDLVPDYATPVKEGGFYGWPWYYIGDHEDPRLKGQRPDLTGKVTAPDLLIQPHSAAVQIRFYDAQAGGSLFPAAYRGGAFIALHGSWNRTSRTGYKVVYAPMKDGQATGEYVDFMTGLVLNDSDVWARPYGIAVAQDGALLVSDDANGSIFRITPAK